MSAGSTGAIRPLAEADLEAVVALSLAAWAPVFASFEAILGPAVFGRLYRPDPLTAQAASVRETCRAADVETHVVIAGEGVVAGFVALRRHPGRPSGDEPGDPMGETSGEVEMIAVHPDHQRQGHGRAMIDFAVRRFREQGVGLVSIGTGGDAAHAPARALYAAAGFTALPLVTYYRALEGRLPEDRVAEDLRNQNAASE